MEIDPVCKMPVDKETTPFKAEYKGREYYFCSAGCKDKFLREPKKYTS